MDILRGFFIDGFVPGDYTYGFVHIASIVIALVLIPVLSMYFENKDSDYVYGFLRYIAIFTLLVYVLRRAIDVYQGKPFLEAFWPFYLCNVNTVFLSIFVIFKVKKGQDFFMITSMLGAVLMFVVPDNVFNDQYLTLGILDSVLSHYEIVVLPLVLLISGAYVLDVRRSWQVLLGLLVLLFNVEVLQPLLTNRHVDYLFIRGDLPFTIDGVPQVIIMYLSITVYVYGVYGLFYYINTRKKVISN
jgi:uncharacterized membrane protein YwaF